MDPTVTAKSSPEPVLVVVGTLVGDEPRFHGPAFSRAAQMFQDELARGLADAGVDLTRIYSIRPLAAFPRSAHLIGGPGQVRTRSGLTVRLLPFINVQPLKALTAGVSTFAALVAWAWRHRGHRRVIHCINLTMPPGAFVLLAARLTGSKASVSLLDVWKPGALVPDSWAWRLDFWFQRFLIPRFDGLMVVSQATIDDLAPGRRACVLEGGIAPGPFTAEPVRRVGHADEQPFRIVLAGSLEPFNGVELVLDAFARLPSGYELVVAGSGSMADLVRAHAERDSRIVYQGFLDFEGVLELYRSADLLLNVRLTRAIDTRYFFPSKLMELLASGTPVLSTCTGLVEDEYGAVAYLLRDETPEALASRIEDIAGLPSADRVEVGRRAHAFMLSNKTWTRQAARLADYIRHEVVGSA
jgi:glycosyltransferase involved in cell wall biosynthesis